MPEAVTGVQTPDKTLVHRIRAGDRAAREELFRRHWGVACRVAYRLLGNEQDAHDAVQEALLKAITHLDDFDGRSEFRTWLLRIVNNASLDLGRRRGRRSTLSLGGDGDGDGNNPGIEPTCEDDPAGGLHREDLRRQLNAALDRLSPPLRTAFVLFAEGGLSYKEIAAAQEIPLGTVTSRINAARQKLQAMLDLDRMNDL
jgi:RNA polymerase sigma-70 factor (ECF subfamily)